MPTIYYVLLGILVPLAASAESDIDINIGAAPSFSIQKRANTHEVVHDRYFIPALVTMGVFTLFSIGCCFMLGWCFNRQRMERFYARRAYRGQYPSGHLDVAPGFDPEKMQHNRPVIILESPDGTSNAPTHSWPRRQSNLQRKPVPSVGSAGGRSNPGSNPASPPLSPQGTRNKELQYASPYGDHQLKNLPPTPAPAPASSHPFQTYSQTQSLAPGPPPPGSQMMSVQHINTTAPSSNRGFWNRMRQTSAMSAGKAESESDSATQLGSGDEGTRPVPVPPPGSSGRGPAGSGYGSGYGAAVGRGRGPTPPAPAPVHLSPHAHAQLYDPHEGNTLSYVSSDSDRTAPMSMPAAVPMVPADSFYGAPSALAQPQAQAQAEGGAPPGYRGPYGSAGEGRGSGYPQEKESRTGGSARGHW